MAIIGSANYISNQGGKIHVIPKDFNYILP